MKIISFAWTTPALLAGRKTCTRRNWTTNYALKFKAGEIEQAYNRNPRIGGKRVGLVRLTEDPYPELTGEAPDSDFEAEGLAWMEDNGLFIKGIKREAECLRKLNRL